MGDVEAGPPTKRKAAEVRAIKAIGADGLVRARNAAKRNSSYGSSPAIAPRTGILIGPTDNAASKPAEPRNTRLQSEKTGVQ